MRDVAASISSCCQNTNQSAPELNLTHQQLYQTEFVLEVFNPGCKLKSPWGNFRKTELLDLSPRDSDSAGLQRDGDAGICFLFVCLFCCRLYLFIYF